MTLTNPWLLPCNTSNFIMWSRPVIKRPIIHDIAYHIVVEIYHNLNSHLNPDLMGSVFEKKNVSCRKGTTLYHIALHTLYIQSSLSNSWSYRESINWLYWILISDDAITRRISLKPDLYMYVHQQLGHHWPRYWRYNSQLKRNQASSKQITICQPLCSCVNVIGVTPKW